MRPITTFARLRDKVHNIGGNASVVTLSKAEDVEGNSPQAEKLQQFRCAQNDTLQIITVTRRALWRAGLVASILALIVSAPARVPAQSITPQPFSPQRVSKEEEEVLIKKAREMGLIPPGAAIPVGIDLNAMKNLLRRYEDLTQRPTITPAAQPVGTVTPAATVTAVGTIVPQVVPPSKIEQSFAIAPPHEVSRALRQFGYDLFGLPSTTFAPTETVSVGPDYQVAPGDELIIYIWGKVLEETLNVVVDRDGRIVLPKVGPLFVTGVQLDKLPQLIKDKLGAAYANFQVTVSLGKLHTISVMVLGEVVRPGTYTVSPFATLFSVLYDAGGPTKNGSLRRIKLTRGKDTVGVVDLYQFLVEGERAQDHKLQANDVIFVPPIGAVAGVAGHVKRPAIFELAGETSAQELLRLAGGFLPGEAQRIQIERFKGAAGRTVEELRFTTREERNQQLANCKIQDGDLLIVYPPATKRHNYVTISGLVLHPGDYEFRPELTLKELIEKAGGVTPTAFLKRVELVRVLNDRPAETIRVDVKDVMDGAPHANVVLKEFDRVRVYDYEYVTVSGMVWNPDRYQWKKGMTVKEALEKAGGVKPGAWLKRGEIVRRQNPSDSSKPDGENAQTVPVLKPVPEKLLEERSAGGSPPPQPTSEVPDHRNEVIAFDVTAALAGDKEANKVLEEYDLIRIYDTADVLPVGKVSITGAVYKPGTYVLTPNMSISDLIFKAGGLRKNALVKKVEVYRTETGQQPKLFILDLEAVLAGKDKTNDLPLVDLDAVYVRRDVHLEQRNRITLTGEVCFPGEYVAEPGERLSSVLKRAGGFTEKAYLPAAVFKRASIQEAQRANIQRFIQTQRESLLREESITPGAELTEAERRQREASLAFRRQLLELVAAVELPGRMVIRLDSPEKLEGTRYDVPIEDGDSLYVPPTPAFVQVMGAVHNATALVFEQGKNLDYYLDKVGGPTREADKSRIYVIKANGEAVYKFARVVPIERGDTIVVPPDVRVRPDWRQLVLDTSKIIANLAIGAAVATR